jgi:hypothetical protein
LEDAKYFGIYKGLVIDNADPINRGRIKLIVPQVFGEAVTEWAWPCLPIVTTENQLDHEEHTAAQIAALLTTQSVGIADSGGDSATVPALTVVAKSGAGALKHPHVGSSDPLTKDGSEDGEIPAEHIYHRRVPEVNQGVWVMFEGGVPDFPVWMGVF